LLILGTHLRLACDDRRMPLSIVSALVRNLITLPAAVLRSRMAKDADAGTVNSLPLRGRSHSAGAPADPPRRPSSSSSSCVWPGRTAAGAIGGYRAIGRLGYAIAPSTVWEILHAAGIDPAPQRSFLTAQAQAVKRESWAPSAAKSWTAC
jgi:putative transposase